MFHDSLSNIGGLSKSISRKDYEDFISVQSELLKHVTNVDNYRATQYKVFSNTVITKDYESQNQRRSYFFQCHFKECSFRNCGLTGSYFVNCIFSDCNCMHAIFDNCYFDNCSFEFSKNKDVLSASFCGSFIKNSSIVGGNLISCSLTNITFYNSSFISCAFDNVIWENAKITFCSFEKVELKNLNIEFVYFYNNKLKDTRLPFASIPFSFKCLDYLSETKDEVTIESETKQNGLSKDEYLSLLPKLISFYKFTNNFFPLANIYASIGEIDNSFETIKKSVCFLVKLHEYRTLKYMSQLMTLYNYSSSQKEKIYKEINHELYKQALTNDDKLLNADLYLYEIRNNLLNETRTGYVVFELFSNIESNEIDKLVQLVSSIERIIEGCQIPNTHSIEYRHNSPYQFLLSIFSSPEGIVEVISILYLALIGTNKFYNMYLDTKQKKLNIKKTKEEIKKMQKPDNTNKINCLEQDLKNVFIELNNKSININTIYHSVYNVDLNCYGEHFQHYSNG